MKLANILTTKKLLAIGCIGSITVAYAADNIEIGFSPNQGSQDLVIKAIASARSSICMAIYNFTSKPIAKAVLDAKKRGVDVRVVSDQKGNSGKYTSVTYLANNGVNIRLNGNYAIMHNKFIVVDNRTVETGSFNYTAAAVNKNAENVIVIWNHPEVAKAYANECDRLFNEASIINPNY